MLRVIAILVLFAGVIFFYQKRTSQHVQAVERPFALFILGTRPEVIKLAPIIQHMQNLSLPFIVCDTGQHQDTTVALYEFFNIPVHIRLAKKQQQQAPEQFVATRLKQLSRLLSLRVKPQFVVVQGDTSSTFVGALAAFYKQIPIVHVEAGLRTYNIRAPFPEESYRVAISHFASLHFAPSHANQQALEREGIPSDSIYTVGNTVVDTLLWSLSKQMSRNTLEFLNSISRPFVLVTLHRRESYQSDALAQMSDAIRQLSISHDLITFFVVLHPNPSVRQVLIQKLSGVKNIILHDSLPYETFVHALDRACLVMSDSGGIQEEATTLGVPLLVLRNETDRLVVDDVHLVGTEAKHIIDAFYKFYKCNSKHGRVSTYGEGTSGIQIVNVMLQMVHNKTKLEL